ncbi:MAG: phosphoenolpyruvate--protein phosphotransferase [Pyrinomonadaceae bacterium]|nr:phosphoenolpyruvate--protein phosphotransferase [Pyrinomonadaceae bacterium]
MSKESTQEQKTTSTHKVSLEAFLKGRAVSRGVGIGKVLYLHGQNRQFYRRVIETGQVGSELKRFRAAVDLAKQQLKEISNGEKEAVSENQSSIFETHLLFLEDRSLLSKIEDIIRDERVNAEWAVKLVTDTYVSRYKLLDDKHLREKYIDLQDISERLLSALGGGAESPFTFDKDSVVVAKEINPSTLVELSQHSPKAIVTENGGWTSHSFILAREMNVPAVTGLKGVLRKVSSGDEIIVDGYNGQVVLNPGPESLDKYRISENQFVKTVDAGFETAEGDDVTLDGVEVNIHANLDYPGGYEHARRFGAKGVGLYRSEFLFNQNKGFPSEELQIASYKKVADLVGEEGVAIRTFDLSVGELSSQARISEKNPALGLKAIRLSLSSEKQFRRQLRALLIASYQRRVEIVLPMISGVAEIRAAKEIIREERKSLTKDSIETGNPGIGAMIEVPSAVFVIDEILKEVDFVSLGTNDLVQYLLAVDRDNESVAESFQTLHPAVLRSVKLVLDSARGAGKPAIVCGEMAGSPLYSAILIGMGATELSMNPNSIPRVRRVVQGIAQEEAAKTTDDLLKLATAGEVEQLVRARFSENWAHLFNYEVLPDKNS